MVGVKKIGMALLAAATIAGSVAATTTSAEARWGHGGWRGGGFGVGAGIATGLAVGALGAGYAYGGYPYGYGYGPGYGAYAYDDGYYGGDCVIRRRVHYGPYGPVVRHVRVCY
jgi:hypothetical protein